MTIAAIVIGGISLVSSIVGNISTNKTNKKIAEQTNAANMQMAEYQAEKNKEMTMELAKYNADQVSPVNQKKLRMEAGFSPLYDGVNSYAPASYQTPYDAPNLDSYRYQNPLNGALDSVISAMNFVQNYKLSEGQLAVQEAQKAYLENQSSLVSAKAIDQGIKNENMAQYWEKRLQGMDNSNEVSRLRSQQLQNIIDSHQTQMDLLKTRVDRESLMLQQEKVRAATGISDSLPYGIGTIINKIASIFLNKMDDASVLNNYFQYNR